MTRAQRLTRLEARWRPVQIAAVLARVRACPEVDRGACLLAELTAVGDLAMCEALMDQLATAELEALDGELEVLLGPGLWRCLDALTPAKLDAFARGNPAVIRQVQRALRSGHQQGDVYP